jgi:hypothetical protein
MAKYYIQYRSRKYLLQSKCPSLAAQLFLGKAGVKLSSGSVANVDERGFRRRNAQHRFVVVRGDDTGDYLGNDYFLKKISGKNNTGP